MPDSGDGTDAQPLKTCSNPSKLATTGDSRRDLRVYNVGYVCNRCSGTDGLNSLENQAI